MSDFLNANGYYTMVASNGAQGVAAFERDPPDLVVADVQLPKKNGFEVCFEIKRTDAGKRTPVLLMSAVYTDKNHAERYAVDLRADGYFIKPFAMNDFLARVRDLIG
jgi:DNA-binding response OmpR family regulator